MQITSLTIKPPGAEATPAATPAAAADGTGVMALLQGLIGVADASFAAILAQQQPSQPTSQTTPVEILAVPESDAAGAMEPGDDTDADGATAADMMNAAALLLAAVTPQTLQQTTPQNASQDATHAEDDSTVNAISLAGKPATPATTVVQATTEEGLPEATAATATALTTKTQTEKEPLKILMEAIEPEVSAKAAVPTANRSGPADTATHDDLTTEWSRALLAAMSEASKDPAAPATTSAQIVAASTEKEAVGQLNIRPESGQTPVVSAPQTANVADPKMTSAPTVERARQPEVLPELAVKSVRLMVSDGLEKLSVRLSPPSLGELHLEVTSSPDGGLQVRLLSGNAGVRDALQGQLPLLREALDRAGFQTAAVTVAPDVSGGAMSGHYLYNQGNGAAQEQQGQLPYHSEKLAREPDTPGARREWAHQGTLNLLA